MGAMSFVNVTKAADDAGACAPGDIDDASSARVSVLRTPMSDRRRSVSITTSPAFALRASARQARLRAKATSVYLRSGSVRWRFLAEDLRFEPPDFGPVFPGVSRQPGLVTGVREKRLGIPLPFRRDLRQQQAPVPLTLDDQSVPADDHVRGSVDRL